MRWADLPLVVGVAGAARAGFAARAACAGRRSGGVGGLGILAWLLLPAALVLPLQGRSLTPHEILARTAMQYRGLATYKFEATTTVVSALIDRNLGHTTKGYSQSRILVAGEPGRIRIENTGGDVDVIYVNDGRTAWTYLPARHQYSRQAGATLIRPGGPDDFLSHNPILAPLNVLVARLSYLDERFGASLEREETLRVGQARIPCWVIAFRDGSGQKQEELWIDEARFLVLRDSADLQEVGGRIADRTGLLVLRDAASTQNAAGQATVSETITVNWTEADVGGALDPRLFESPAPAKARLVEAANIEGLARDRSIGAESSNCAGAGIGSGAHDPRSLPTKFNSAQHGQGRKPASSHRLLKSRARAACQSAGILFGTLQAIPTAASSSGDAIPFSRAKTRSFCQ